MAFNISYIFQAVDKFSHTGLAVSNALKNVKKSSDQAKKAAATLRLTHDSLSSALKNSSNVQTSWASKFSSASKRIVSFLESIRNKAQSVYTSLGPVSKKLSEMGKKAFIGLTLPIGGLSVAALKASASMESMRTSFEILLQNKDKAASLMKEIKKFAELTPFELTDISASITQLLGATIPLDQIIPKMTMLADIASAVNVPLTNMTHIFAKSTQKGKAMAEELNQFAENGIPIMAELAKMANAPVARIYKAAEKGEITYEIILKAFQRMTREGGMFYKSSVIQSKTLVGIWGTLKDAIFFTLDTIGSTVIDAFNLKPMMIAAIKWLEHFEVALAKFVKDYPKLSKFIVILLAIASVIAPLLLALSVIIKLFLFMGIGLKALGIILRLMFLGPIGLIITAIGLLVIALIYAYNNFEPIRKIIDFICSGVGALIKGIYKLGSALISLSKPFALIKQVGAFAHQNVMANPSATSPLSGIKSPIATSVTNANATVSININDKNNNVKSVQTTKKGFMELAVGKNMAGV